MPTRVLQRLVCVTAGVLVAMEVGLLLGVVATCTLLLLTLMPPKETD